jgi:hypothetical protein
MFKKKKTQDSYHALSTFLPFSEVEQYVIRYDIRICIANCHIYKNVAQNIHYTYKYHIYHNTQQNMMCKDVLKKSLSRCHKTYKKVQQNNVLQHEL